VHCKCVTCAVLPYAQLVSQHVLSTGIRYIHCVTMVSLSLSLYIYIYIYIYTHIYIYIYTHIYLHILIYIYIYMYIYIYVYILCKYIYMCICRECNESRPRTDESFPQAKGGPGGQTAIDPMALGNRQSRRSVLMHICMCVCVYYCMLLYLYTGYFANCVLYMCLYVVYFGNYTCV